MTINGHMLIGSQEHKGAGTEIHAVNPATGEQLDPGFGSGNEADVNRAAGLAWEAFDAFRETAPETRATFLETCAEQIMALGDELVQRAMAESGLPQARIEGERGRTVNQLKLFATVVRQGHYLDARIDPAQKDRSPQPRADLRMRQIGLGPVAVFGASNFPLAFSVAGGDTASALAAGCPVIVKAHSAHPGTSELVGQAIRRAVVECQLPEGVFSLLFGSGRVVGAELVKHPNIKAVGFTGSRSGGTALVQLAQNRPEPIPVYAEMSSINPVFLMPGALAANAESVAKGFVGSLSMGAGQFCTNPGLLIGVEGKQLDDFVRIAADEVSSLATQTMLTPGVHAAYCEGVDRLRDNPRATEVARGRQGEGKNQCQAGLYTTTAEDFMSDESLGGEVFGATALIVKCKTADQLRSMAEHLEGQLTATVQYDSSDIPAVRALLPVLERRVGRILCNGYPTGVEVCHAMVHGGPHPATSDSRATSVGSSSIQRFLRPVCYQDLPQELLPEALRDGNPLGIRRLVDGADSFD